MARGWESKHVESQQDQARGERFDPGAREPVALDERRGLELACADLRARLARVGDGPQRRSLQLALRAIEERLARL
jgi:hypothetical protein